MRETPFPTLIPNKDPQLLSHGALRSLMITIEFQINKRSYGGYESYSLALCESDYIK